MRLPRPTDADALEKTWTLTTLTSKVSEPIYLNTEDNIVLTCFLFEEELIMRKKAPRQKPWLWSMILLAAVIPSCSRDPSPEPTGRSDTHAEKPRTAEDLILQLRSANKDPNPNRDMSLLLLPEDYDWEAQEEVGVAYRKLIALGKDAFPALIDHVNEPAYSLSRSMSIMRSFSVGEVCFMILEDQVDLGKMNYKGRPGSDGKSHQFKGYFSQFSGGRWYSQDGLRAWWRGHRQMTLREMQVEALQWRIERERAIGFPGEGDRERYLKPLLEQLDALARSSAING